MARRASLAALALLRDTLPRHEHFLVVDGEEAASLLLDLGGHQSSESEADLDLADAA